MQLNSHILHGGCSTEHQFGIVVSEGKAFLFQELVTELLTGSDQSEPKLTVFRSNRNLFQERVPS